MGLEMEFEFGLFHALSFCSRSPAWQVEYLTLHFDLIYLDFHPVHVLRGDDFLVWTTLGRPAVHRNASSSRERLHLTYQIDCVIASGFHTAARRFCNGSSCKICSLLKKSTIAVCQVVGLLYKGLPGTSKYSTEICVSEQVHSSSSG